MNWARSAGLAAWTVIHASAHRLWQGTPLAGDRKMVGPSPNTHGSGGPVAACRQSSTTPSGVAGVLLVIAGSPVVTRQEWFWLAGPGDGSPPGPALLLSGGCGRDLA